VRGCSLQLVHGRVVVLLGLPDVVGGVVLLEPLGVKFNWGLCQSLFLPEFWGEVATGLGDGLERSLSEVTEGGGTSLGRSVDVFVAGVVQDLLGNGRGDDTGTPGGRDQPHVDGTAFGVHLAGDGVGFTELGAPVASSDRDDRQLGQGDGRPDSHSHFFGRFDAEADVAVVVSDDDGGLKPGPLAGPGLLLNRVNLQDLVLQSLTQKVLDNFGLLDGQRKAIDLSQAADPSFFDKSAKLGDWHPLLLFVAAAASATTTASTTTTTAATAAKSTSVVSFRSVSHDS
jgi:hypothetical protein